MCTCIGLKKGEDAWGIDVVLINDWIVNNVC